MITDVYEELKGHQPEFYVDFIDMQEYLKALGCGLKELLSRVNNMWDDTSIDSLTEYGVIRWEKILKIPIEGYSLQIRRATVKTKLMGFSKLSTDVIKALTLQYFNDSKTDAYVVGYIIYIELFSVPTADMKIEKFLSLLGQLKPTFMSISIGFQNPSIIGIKETLNMHKFEQLVASTTTFVMTQDRVYH